MFPTNRREFFRYCTIPGIALLDLRADSSKRFLIEAAPQPSLHRSLAERELLRGLSLLSISNELRLAEQGQSSGDQDIVFRFRRVPEHFKNKEAYSISARSGEVVLSAATDLGLLYAVFDFLERQGVFFGIDGESYPPEVAGTLALPEENHSWYASPRFSVRGLLPWPDFLNCISVYNDEDFRTYFEGMLRMRFNTFGMHVYSSPGPLFADAESYLSFEFAGVGHQAYLDNTASQRWGYLPQRTSRYGMGGSEFFHEEVFGSEATTLGRNPWDIAERTRALLQRSLAFAKKHGLATGIGFEPYQVPEAVLAALPPEIKPKPGRTFPGGAAFDVESVTGRKLLEARLGELLDAYPDVDYVWLWEDENMNWESRKTGVPLSVTPFQQAYDFLKRNAPQKRMVLSGWGGVVRHFEYFHRKLPLDIVFSCLNDSLGWDPVNEVFGKLEGRERWPIPWLEDDPAMWLPQFHVNRTHRDIELASQMGCQGILGIHWRHRILDVTAGYLARGSWNSALTPTAHFEAYARSQASGERARKLAVVLADADLNQKMLHTGTDEIKDGHVVTREWTPDYDEGFLFWRDYEPGKTVLQEQANVAATLGKLRDSSSSPVERERLGYLAGFFEFAVPYGDAWTSAHHLHSVLDRAEQLKSAGHVQEAKQQVITDGLPLWMKLAPLVRETILRYQSIVATRNDLGQLASMHNKYVRLALFRLPLSIQEYLGEIPPDMAELLRATIQPDSHAPARLFAPTRPGILAVGERVRIMVVATGNAQPEGVTLYTRLRGESNWNRSPAKLLGRKTYEAILGPFDREKQLAEYYVSASIGGNTHVAPVTAPERTYMITLV